MSKISHKARSGLARLLLTSAAVSALTLAVAAPVLAQTRTPTSAAAPSAPTQTAMQTPMQTRGELVPVQTFTLPNGLSVVFHIDRSDPVTAVVLAAHVGSARETPGRTGFAHMFEHLFFLDSENLGPGGLDKLSSRIGGSGANGSTSRDATDYLQTVPNDALEKMIWAEADKLGYFINTVTDPVLAKEKQVVKNEKRQSYDNRPYGHTMSVIMGALYPADHPYNWPVIGSLADLDAATLEDVRDFYRRWYTPNNTTLVIAGPQWRDGIDPESKLLRAATDAVWIVTRLTADNIADRETARTLLATQRITPSEGASVSPAFAPPILEPPVRASVEAIADLSPEIFLHRLAVLLARHPNMQTREGLDALAQIDVTPGRPYVPPRRDSKAYQAAIRGLADGLGRIRHAAAATHPSSGWRQLYSLPPHPSPLERASAALLGLGAPAADSILHMICETDHEGRPLSGGERYECCFPAGGRPPVDAFWSLSLHDRPSHGELLLHRHALSDRDRLSPEANGDLRLLVQHTPPSSDHAANWLPSPSGRFALVLQLFGPKAHALSGAWSPPPLRRIGGAAS